MPMRAIAADTAPMSRASSRALTISKAVAIHEDAQGFNYGIGIQPFGQIGATKIFNCTGNFDVQTSITALHGAANAAGATISNNSWGSAINGAYDTTAREFDALVRDVQPGRRRKSAIRRSGVGGKFRLWREHDW